MLEAQRADVETSSALNADPKPPRSPDMSVHQRDHAQAPPSRGSRYADRGRSPTQLAPIQDRNQYANTSDPWADAFRALQQHVEYQSGLLQEQRHHLQDMDRALERLHADVSAVWQHVERYREEVHSLATLPKDRADAGDIDVLTSQLQSVAAKASEIDGLKVQLDLATRRMRRLEGNGTPPPQAAPSIEPSPYVQRHAYPPSTHLPPPETSATDPRTLSYPPSQDIRLPPPSALQSSDSLTFAERPPPADSRTLPGFRSIDPTSNPTPTTWRAATGYAPSQIANVAPEPALRHPLVEPQQATGWAAVNVHHAGKRGPSLDAGQPHDGSAPSSPKRQKLATLMPRTSYGEQSAMPHHNQPTGTPESIPSLQPTRTSSGDSQLAQFTAASTSAPNALRFVQAFPSTQEADSQDSWRPESQRRSVDSARGRNRGARGSRGRGRRSAGSVGPEREAEQAPDWERASWSGSQIGPDGYYHPGQAPTSAASHASHGSPPEPAAPMLPTAYSGERETASSAPLSLETSTQSQLSAASAAAAAAADSASKKSRTKPVRNAEGILIRKDGRPDMRSVSSAMNLRKVHAKKEAEKHGGNPGGTDTTPTSAGVVGRLNEMSDSGGDRDSDSPATPYVGDAPVDDGPAAARPVDHGPGRKLFPYGLGGGAPSVATDNTTREREPWFTRPLQDREDVDRSGNRVKSERSSQPPGTGEARNKDRERGVDTDMDVDPSTDAARARNESYKASESQMSDTVMRELSDAQMGDRDDGSGPR